MGDFAVVLSLLLLFDAGIGRLFEEACEVRGIRGKHRCRVSNCLRGLCQILVFLVALSLSNPVRDPTGWAAEADLRHRLYQLGGAVMRAVFVPDDRNDADLAV